MKSDRRDPGSGRPTIFRGMVLVAIVGVVLGLFAANRQDPRMVAGFLLAALVIVGPLHLAIEGNRRDPVDAGEGAGEDRNPYEAPRSVVGSVTREGDATGRPVGQLLSFWLVVFLFNMAIPLLFGWSFTRTSGRVGMFAAALALLVLGGWVCTAARRVGLSLVVGATLVALSQLVPMLQIAAGLAGIAMGQGLGLTTVPIDHDNDPEQVIGELGGFVVTFATGGLLILASGVIGTLLRMMTPRRWWGEPDRAV